MLVALVEEVVRSDSVQFSCSVMSDPFVTPWTAAHKASLSITNSRSPPKPCPLGQWCHPTISSSVVPFSSYPQSFPVSGSFPYSCWADDPQTAEQLYQRNSRTVKKVLGPTTDFPTWGSSKRYRESPGNLTLEASGIGSQNFHRTRETTLGG